MTYSPVIVVGPWRSGTSCVAGMVHRLGFSMGSMFHIVKGYCTYEDGALCKILHRHIDESQAVRGEVVVRAGLLEELTRWAKHRNNPIFGAKHPLFCFALPHVEAAFPGCKYVVVRRDTDAAAKSLAATRWFKGDATDAIASACEFRDRGLGSIAPDRIFNIRYGKLVSDPRTVAWELAQFLGVDDVEDADTIRSAADFVDPAMNHHTEASHI